MLLNNLRELNMFQICEERVLHESMYHMLLYIFHGKK